MTNLQARILSALVMGPTALVATGLGGIPFWLMIAAVALLGVVEWLRLVGAPARAAPVALAGLIAGLAVGYWAGYDWGVGAILAGLVAVAAIARSPMVGFGVAYIGIPGLALLWLRGDPDAGLVNIILLFMTVWASDIGGYVAGRVFGGPKLAPRISPAKTWAGLFGSVALAMVTGAAVLAIADGLRLAHFGALVGGLLSLIAQAGDLFESALKRRYQAKDSGDLIPGHGGVLDRIDGLLAAAPAFAALHILMLS